MSSIRYLSLLAAAAAPLAAAAGGDVINLAGLIRHPITAKLPDSSNDWIKRQTAVELEDQRTGTLYTIDLGVGTPAQVVSVIIDTGSSVFWINPDCSKAGSESNVKFCESLPPFSPNKSSSLEDLGYTGDISYGKGHVHLEYVSDYVSLGCKLLSSPTRFFLSTSMDLARLMFALRLISREDRGSGLRHSQGQQRYPRGPSRSCAAYYRIPGSPVRSRQPGFPGAHQQPCLLSGPEEHRFSRWYFRLYSRSTGPVQLTNVPAQVPSSSVASTP